MSCCLHRYFSHQAFETSRILQCILGMIACLAFQGGPLQWAENHKKHHIFCDMPKDPHSAKQHGFWYAFIGWMASASNYKSNDSDYTYIKHDMKTFEMRIIQLLNPAPGLGLCYIVFQIFGFVCMMWTTMAPMLLCRTITLLFNVEFHPPDVADKCLAIDNNRIFAKIVGESQHKQHHLHPRKAHRCDFDVPYWTFLHVLKSLNLIWNLK